MPVGKTKQQRDIGMMLLAEIVNQTIIGPLKDNEGVKLNSVIDCEFMNKIF